MRIDSFRLRGTVESSVDAEPLIQEAGEAAIVHRGRRRLLILRCPCGCGETLRVNLDERAGPAWRFYFVSGVSTVFPSIWRDSGCGSHFIIWRDEIYLFGALDDEDRSEAALPWRQESRLSPDRVLHELSGARFEDPVAIADRIDALPWDVLSACRTLVNDGRATRGKGRELGKFKRS